MSKRDDKGRFPKGTSGNPNGGKTGPRQGMTTKQRAQALAKGSQKAMNKVLELIGSKNDNVALKAALSWVAEDLKFRELLMKEVKHALEVKKMKQELKEAENSKDDEEDDNYKAPVVSFKAVE